MFNFAGRKRAFPPTQAEIDRFPPVTHPIVRTHPVTGCQCLYVMRDDCTGIEGLDQEEGEAPITALADHLVNPAFIYRHQMAAEKPLEVGQFQGAASRDTGLQSAATAADASHDNGQRDPDVIRADPHERLRHPVPPRRARDLSGRKCYGGESGRAVCQV